MRCCAVGLVSFVAMVAISAAADAQPAPAPTPTGSQPAPEPPPLTARGKPAIARVAEAIATSLSLQPGRTLVAASMPTSEAPAPRAAQLAVTIASQVAGRIGAGARHHPEPIGLAEARRAAHADGRLVHLVIEIAAGQLRVAADVYPTKRTIWQRARFPDPGSVAHAFAHAPIDAEVRSFLAPIPLVVSSQARAQNFESDVVALACGDLDADGALEIVSVGRRRVTTLRLRGGKVQPIVSRPWPELAPVHPTPLREPLGWATIVARGADASREEAPALLDIGLTDRARSLRLDARLRVLASFPGIAVPDGDASACTKVWALTVTGPIGPCTVGDPTPSAPSIGGQYDAFASARLVTRAGKPYVAWAGRERNVVELRDSEGARATFDGAGAQLAIGDLDQDGEPEIVSSLDVSNPAEDAVVVRTWTRSLPSGAPPNAPRLREIAKIPAAAGVHAIGICPPDGPGIAPFVVATLDEIWVVR